ncbi:MAG: hypothetical protein ACPGU1_15115 [Myxococcota bacterium]
MSEQENTPSLFRWAALAGAFCVAFMVVKTVFEVAFTALFYGGVTLVAAGIAVRVVKKLKS